MYLILYFSLKSYRSNFICAIQMFIIFSSESLKTNTVLFGIKLCWYCTTPSGFDVGLEETIVAGV